MSEPTIAQLKNVIKDLENDLKTEREHRQQDARKLAATEQKLNDVTKGLHGKVLDSEFSRIAHSMGWPPEAVPDALNHVEQHWSVGEDGAPVLKNATGIDDPTPERWMAEQKKTRFSYLFRSGQQQAGGGGSAGGFSGEKNPWEANNWDDMAQVALMRTNPDKAKQLAAAAGSKVGALRPDPNVKPPF